MCLYRSLPLGMDYGTDATANGRQPTKTLAFERIALFRNQSSSPGQLVQMQR